MRIVAASTALFDGYGMAAAIEGIARAGLNWVEPAFIGGYVDFVERDFEAQAARALRRRLTDAGLRVQAVSAHMDLGGGDDTSAMLARRIRFVSELGAKVLISNAGLAARRDQIVARIEEALPLCEAAGVTLALENPGHGRGALISNARDGMALLRAFPHPKLAVNYDAGNAWSYSGGHLQPAQDISAAGVAGIAHLHVKDVTDENGDWRFVAAGDGAVDYAALWPLLPRDLPLSLELPLRLTRPKRGDPLRASAVLPEAAIKLALRRSVAFVRLLDTAR